MKNKVALEEHVATERVLFSNDHPFESMKEASDWFDACDIGDHDREAIGYRNARRLFKL